MLKKFILKEKNIFKTKSKNTGKELNRNEKILNL